MSIAEKYPQGVFDEYLTDTIQAFYENKIPLMEKFTCADIIRTHGLRDRNDALLFKQYLYKYYRVYI